MPTYLPARLFRPLRAVPFLLWNPSVSNTFVAIHHTTTSLVDVFCLAVMLAFVFALIGMMQVLQSCRCCCRSCLSNWYCSSSPIFTEWVCALLNKRVSHLQMVPSWSLTCHFVSYGPSTFILIRCMYFSSQTARGILKGISKLSPTQFSRSWCDLLRCVPNLTRDAVNISPP